MIIICYYLFQITSSYGPSLSYEVNGRKDFLKKKYNFICECEACVNNWSCHKVFNSIKFLKFICNLLILY